jgi:hypothetical protein
MWVLFDVKKKPAWHDAGRVFQEIIERFSSQGFLRQLPLHRLPRRLPLPEHRWTLLEPRWLQVLLQAQLRVPVQAARRMRRGKGRRKVRVIFSWWW